jgi:hypothetical protein
MDAQTEWLIKFLAGCVILACIAFPPLILVVVPAWIWLYMASQQPNEGKK